MKKIYFIMPAVLTFACLFLLTESLYSKQTVKRKGNTETVESVEKGKIEYRIVYTYEGSKKVKGEYWEPVDPKEQGKDKPKSNILAGTAVAKYYEKMIAGSSVKDQSDIEIDIVKNGFILKSVKTVKYNDNGQPEHTAFRGYSSYPVLGVFNLKTDWDYSYDAGKRLSGIVEKNMSIDSLLLNFAAENTTKIERDKSGRPVKITRTIGTVPPAFETTDYAYKGTGMYMVKTIYGKCALDAMKLEVLPSETITTTYGSNVPWEGMKKYDFTMGKTVTGFSVYDEVDKKQKLDGSGFMKMSVIQKGMFLKNLYTYQQNEQKGPKWRMGELPDIPDPFLIYKDNVWYK